MGNTQIFMPTNNPFNLSSFAFATLVFLHLLGMIWSLGIAATMDLQLLGVGIGGGSPAKFWRETWLLALVGLSVSIVSGFLLFTIEPAVYYENQVFQFKMAALVVAIGFYFTLVRRAAVHNRKASIVAALSLGLFALVPLGGILIGYE